MIALAHLAPFAATALASAIWQSALLALGVVFALRVLPGITAAARSVLWTAVFLLAFALPLAHLLPRASVRNSAQPGLHVAPGWAFALAALWASLSLVRAARLLHSAVRLYRVATEATPIFPPAGIAAVLAAAPTAVQLCTSLDVDVPSVAGFFHPRILLPATLLDHLSPADLHQIVLHEIEHLRRRDDWTNLLQKVALVLFPLNPVLLWVERRLCVERELACDDGVLRVTGGAGKAYATCLANLAEASLLRRGLALALGAWQRKSELTRRVHRILSNPTRQMRPAGAAALVVLILGATLGAGMLAAKSPELITFTSAPTGFSGQAASAPTLRAFHPTLVKATASQGQPAMTLLVAHRPATHQAARPLLRTRVGPAVRRRPSNPNMVLIGWQRTEVPAHWTIASYPSSTFTYAAVPTRTGWLFFQL